MSSYSPVSRLHQSRLRQTHINPAINQCARIRPFASVMDSKVRRIVDDLEKPDLDDRSYRVIQLPNSLEALLVHDPQTDKASASLNVNVGNFSDDDDMPGMAHAVEHLLFMGTEKVRRSNIEVLLVLWLTLVTSTLSRTSTAHICLQILDTAMHTLPRPRQITSSNAQPRTNPTIHRMEQKLPQME